MGQSLVGSFSKEMNPIIVPNSRNSPWEMLKIIAF
jgi:hypothetical protein